jgi:hypothetical protein
MARVVLVLAAPFMFADAALGATLVFGKDWGSLGSAHYRGDILVRTDEKGRTLGIRSTSSPEMKWITRKEIVASDPPYGSGVHLQLGSQD